MKAVCTDLDDTLLRSDNTLSPTNLATLEDLGKKAVLRVVATGRSLEVSKRVLTPETPIDYLIFATGGGIVDWSNQKLITKHSLTPEQVDHIVATLLPLRCDFMVHHPIPNNHCFAYHGQGHPNSDFLVRVQRDPQFSTKLMKTGKGFGEAAQVLVIDPSERVVDRHQELSTVFPDLTVIRTTSPLDRKSAWIEIFPKQVSKSQAVAWLLTQHQITADQTVVIGNDYNDLDLLEWAGKAFVVANAPKSLKEKFEVVPSQDEDGFTHALNAK